MMVYQTTALLLPKPELFGREKRELTLLRIPAPPADIIPHDTFFPLAHLLFLGCSASIN
jgi:hypothetical protein